MDYTKKKVNQSVENAQQADVPYDRRKLSYANTFTNPFQRNTIKTLELLTGKLRLLRKVRQFEKMGIPFGQPFWSQALDLLGIELLTSESEISRIPKKGPLVIVANHPHGLVDGMVLAELIGTVRTDYKILTRSLLTGVKQIDQFMIPVPFDHEENALQKSLEMRRFAMKHLENDGVLVLFPSGKVASSDTIFGSVVEGEWSPFTAKLIQKSNADVLPIFFPGSNSRMYQIANQISATLRQGLLIYEVVHAMNKPQKPVVGNLIKQDEISSWRRDPRGFMRWLRDTTIALGSRR
ncbi:MAG: lysophospholipid acyltransferase family protein [Pseudomonadota bacterium]|nr:lysophospholipid acyltransferase family protein [Pseudomonadota bacterium]